MNDFTLIEQRINAAIANGEPLTVTTLLQQMAGLDKEKYWQVLEHLLGEQKIAIDSLGRITTK